MRCSSMPATEALRRAQIASGTCSLICEACNRVLYKGKGPFQRPLSAEGTRIDALVGSTNQ